MQPLWRYTSAIWLRAFTPLVCCSVATTGWGQIESRSSTPQGNATDRLYAAPDLGVSSPFLPANQQQVELPVALSGFSTVALRDQQKWIPGNPQFQLVFDGQIYFFSSERDRAIFTAAPQNYAPVLGGDCVVTYVSTGKRTMGKLEYGLIHARRLYFFAGPSELQQFREDSGRYANGDLANEGKCLVSHFEEGRDVTGMPETVALVNGLRYLFAGAYERNLFAANMARYGVERELLHPKSDQSVNPLRTDATSARSKVRRGASQQHQGAEPLPKASEKEEDDHQYVMEGYCPVSIQEQGVWVRGSYQNMVNHEGRKYLLAGEKEKKLFLENPERFAPALGGDCVVTLTDEGKLVAGSVYHPLIYEGKLYLFAGPDQVQAFKEHPEAYVENLPKEDETPAESEIPADEAALSQSQSN